jgi:hypothetical protein
MVITSRYKQETDEEGKSIFMVREEWAARFVAANLAYWAPVIERSSWRMGTRKY